MSKHFNCTTCQCENEIESITSSNSDDDALYVTYNKLEINKIIAKLFNVDLKCDVGIEIQFEDAPEPKAPEVKKQRGRPRKNFEIKQPVKKGIVAHPEYYDNNVFSNKLYYETNKAKLKEKQQVKETCECGAICQKGKMHKHIKSKRHIQTLNKINEIKQAQQLII